LARFFGCFGNAIEVAPKTLRDPLHMPENDVHSADDERDKAERLKKHLRVWSVCAAAFGTACLFFGGSRRHDSILGLSLVVVGVLALAASIFTLAISRWSD